MVLKKKFLVETSARIHINSLKMNDDGCWGGGGIGFPLKNPKIKINVTKNKGIKINCKNTTLKNIILKYCKELCKNYNLEGIYIDVKSFFLPHHGLGSETQSALLVGLTISRLYGLNLTYEEISKNLGVAGVSGIGYYSFIKGGFVIEGGYPMGLNEEKKNFGIHSSKPPLMIMNLKFPKKFKILLIIPQESPSSKLSKEDENILFDKHTPISKEETGEICSSTLMGVIPGIKLKDYEKLIKHLMHISILGTKRIELELNKSLIKYIQDRLKNLVDFKYIREKEAKFILKNDEKTLEKYIHKNESKINFRKPIPWLGLSSLGSTFYSILNLQKGDEVRLKKEIEKRD